MPDSADMFVVTACLAGYMLGRYHGEQQAYTRVVKVLREMIREALGKESS